MRYPTKDAMEYLSSVLHLPATGREQDWDVELADSTRVSEFIAHLESHKLDKDKEHLLMALILASLDDLAYVEEIEMPLWNRVQQLLRNNPTLFADLVARWRSPADDPDGFAIAPLMRMM